MKMYAMATDVSPSEQLTGDDSELKAIGMVLGLRHKNSFDEVGDQFPDASHRFTLKKWTGSSNQYKQRAIDHARFLQSTGNVMFGTDVASERAIKEIGTIVFQKLAGNFPKPSGQNKKGKPRIALGGYQVDEKRVPRFDVLLDELIVLGWYIDVITSFHEELVKINEKDVKLDVIIDRLPLEQGGEENFKATLLKHLLAKASKNLVNLVGVPEVPDGAPRDLLVDNIAGMARETVLRPKSQLSQLIIGGDSLLRFSRVDQ